MNGFALFTDVSLNPKLQLGVGAYLMVPDLFLRTSPDNIENARANGPAFFVNHKNETEFAFDGLGFRCVISTEPRFVDPNVRANPPK